ncbi:MAG: LrgB family protein, partial [Alistipes sp.]|nr:LrgB family protein [Alistipes sp.]
MIQEFLSSQLFLLMLTVAFYSGGMAIYRRTRTALLHPVVLTFLAMIAFLSIFNIPYSTYREATQILDFGLGMSVVALGYLLYEQEQRMKGHVVEILTAVGVGSVVGVLSVVYIAKWLGADRLIQDSIAMKSVTVPIAVGISERIGGDLAISSVVVFV